jgi:hypothetical protein
MRFLRRHWYILGLALAIIALAWGLMSDLTEVQWILLLNFVALPLHQFEEYGWPGGFPWIYNEVVAPSGGPPDRFPLNQNSALFINVTAWPFCFTPVLFPDQRSLGLAMALFAFGQLVYHGVVTNRKFKRLYNPGLALVVLGQVLLGIWYLTEIYSKSTVTLAEWGGAIVYLGSFMGVVMQLIGFKVLPAKRLTVSVHSGGDGTV